MKDLFGLVFKLSIACSAWINAEVVKLLVMHVLRENRDAICMLQTSEMQFSIKRHTSKTRHNPSVVARPDSKSIRWKLGINRSSVRLIQGSEKTASNANYNSRSVAYPRFLPCDSNVANGELVISPEKTILIENPNLPTPK